MAALIGVVIVAPFELPLLVIPGGLTITTVEVALLLALSAGFRLFSRPRGLWPTPLSLPGAMFVTVLLVAALVAPVEPGNALRFAGRMAMASAVFVLFANVVDNAARAATIVRTLVAVATIVGTIAMLEAAEVPAAMNALTLFRPGFHVVAGQLRATSTLFYPTIASMYLEMAFALGLWLLLDPSTSHKRIERATIFAALVIIGAGIAATFTRAGLAGMAACLALVALLRVTRLSTREAGLETIAGLAMVLMAVVFLTHSPDLLMTRLSTEGSGDWYGARYNVPARLNLQTGRTEAVPIAVTNTGRLIWDSQRDPAFALSYHWLRSGFETVVHFEGDRTPFPSPVAPGATSAVSADVTAPAEPGEYTLVWDVVHETRAWLSTEGVQPGRTEVTVQGARVGAVVATMDRLPRASIRPARPALWAAAVRIASEHPWLGIGPDNFRLVYGRYAGLERWDTRVHANNMYLEILTGAGIAGLLTLLWLFAAAGLALWRRCRTVPAARLMPAAAALAAWLMVVGHGLVDSFLSFTTTYVTFAMAAGLAFSPGLTGHTRDDADRV